jgi:N-acetylglucosamine-6-phosphate deacetylase
MATGCGIPGFVDLQVNGFLGVDFSSPNLSEEAFLYASLEYLKSGTAAFLPTLITSPLEVYQRNLPIIARVCSRPEFYGKLPGIHLEGPFISAVPGAVGAHNPAWTLAPDQAVLERLQEWSGGTVRLLTLAGELPGAVELAAKAVQMGITVSNGHSLATAEDLDHLQAAGARALTHLGNGLPASLPKFANPLWAGLANENYMAMFIADGHHIPGGILKAMIRAKRTQRCVIVSDAAPIAGLPPGEYTTLGNRVILEPTGRLYNPEQGYLVGSSYSQLKCMNFLASLDFLTLPELLDLGFYHPLRLIRIAPERIATSPTELRFDESSKQFQINTI